MQMSIDKLRKKLLLVMNPFLIETFSGIVMHDGGDDSWKLVAKLEGNGRENV